MSRAQQIAADTFRLSHETAYEAKAEAEKKKDKYTLVLLGGAQSGKSTLLGQIYYKLGGIDKKDITAFEAEAARLGRKDSAFAWVVDQSQQERASGSTAKCNYLAMPTEKYDIIFIDTPGDCTALNHAIAGIGHADAALLVVPAELSEFQSQMKSGGPVREYLSLAFNLGLRTLLIAVTKMDLITDHAQTLFSEIKRDIGNYAQKLGFAPASIVYVPVSGLQDWNLIEINPDWEDWSPIPTTFYNALQTPNPSALLRQQGFSTAASPGELPADAGLRCTILDVDPGAAGTAVVIGRVVAGSLLPNKVLTVAPGTATVRVESVHQVHSVAAAIPFALPGDLVSLALRDVPASLAAGQVLTDSGPNRARGATEFTARLTVHDEPEDGLRPGYQALLNVHGAEIRCEVTALVNQLDRRRNTVLTMGPECLRNQQMGDVRLRPLDPVSLDLATTHSRLGMVVLRFVPPADALPPEDPDDLAEAQRIVAVGTVISIVAV